MKPVDFDYARPATLAAALDLLAQNSESAKVIAGGQSLGPMLNLRLVQPEMLIDITGIPELREIREEGEKLIIGASVTHAEIEDHPAPGATRAVLARVAYGIAYRAVRNRGTLGGSLAHADPAADWVVCTTALGAELLLSGKGGERRIRVAEFIEGAFETALGPEEIIVAVSIPLLSPAARFGYYKVCRKRGEFADASAAVLLDPERGVERSVIGATAGSPVLIEDGRPLKALAEEDSVAAALASSAIARDPFALRVHGVALRRAIAMAA